jgi:hypothetical protein
MAKRPLSVNFVTVVWGDWHTSAFLALNLPTLLAPGNLPALSEQWKIVYDIYTRAADIEKIEQSQVGRWLRRIALLRINVISEEIIGDPIRAHHEIWLEAIEKAQRERAFVLLMPPDVVWSDGAFRHVGTLLARGKKVVFNFYLRVVSDTFAQDFTARYGGPDGVLAAPPRQMVELSMSHIHPLMAAYLRGSDHFPHHAEMVIWPVRGEGLLVRVLAREALLFDPNVFALNDRQLVDGRASREEIEFVGDSDELFAVSLAPLGKDIEWCLRRQRAEFTWIARWWLHYDSALNDIVSSAKIRIHHGEPTPASWRAVEFASNIFIRRAATVREAIRVWRALHELKCERVAEILALAIHTGAIQQLTSDRGPVLVLAPSDDAIDLIPERELDKLISSGARDLLRAHLVVLGDNEPEIEERLARNREIELTSAAGSVIRIRASWRREDKLAHLLVNGEHATSASLRTGRSVVLRLDGILWPHWTAPRSPQTADITEASAIETVR